MKAHVDIDNVDPFMDRGRWVSWGSGFPQSGDVRKENIALFSDTFGSDSHVKKLHERDLKLHRAP